MYETQHFSSYFLLHPFGSRSPHNYKFVVRLQIWILKPLLQSGCKGTIRMITKKKVQNHFFERNDCTRTNYLKISLLNRNSAKVWCKIMYQYFYIYSLDFFLLSSSNVSLSCIRYFSTPE